LVPLYLEITTGERIEEAVAKADFGEVWNVLQALQEQDEMLAEIIRQIQEDKGKGGEQKGDDFGDIVNIIGVDISLKTLQESITAVCIDKLGFTWDMRYGELIKYKEQFGHCNVPKKWAENKQLAYWVVTQRGYYRDSKLSNDRIKRLEEIGFEWDPFELSWEDNFDALKEYKKNHGHCNVPKNWSENKQLAKWMSHQRGYYRNKKLSDDRVKRLEDIGFEWDPLESQWKQMFAMLKKHKDKHGNCNVPQKWTGNRQLGSWVSSQRGYYRDKQLSNDKIKHLEDIGFEWDIYESQWEQMFAMLIKYKDKHGDCNIPRDWTENKQLANWVNAQRGRYRITKLSDDRIKRLEDIGFEWDTLELQWEEMFVKLKEYKRKYGNCNVSLGWTENIQLANWVNAQRVNYRITKLSDDRVKRLEDIGFEWKRISYTYTRVPWGEKFVELKEYKKNHGDCNVPRTLPENKQLAKWVSHQRSNYRNKKLSDERIKSLEDIGFVWNIHKR
jgi:hypothetical protein